MHISAVSSLRLHLLGIEFPSLSPSVNIRRATCEVRITCAGEDVAVLLTAYLCRPPKLQRGTPHQTYAEDLLVPIIISAALASHYECFCIQNQNLHFGRDWIARRDRLTIPQSNPLICCCDRLLATHCPQDEPWDCCDRSPLVAVGTDGWGTWSGRSVHGRRKGRRETRQIIFFKRVLFSPSLGSRRELASPLEPSKMR